MEVADFVGINNTIYRKWVTPDGVTHRPDVRPDSPVDWRCLYEWYTRNPVPEDLRRAISLYYDETDKEYRSPDGQLWAFFNLSEQERLTYLSMARQ